MRVSAPREVGVGDVASEEQRLPFSGLGCQIPGIIFRVSNFGYQISDIKYRARG